jgi:hypothetical protein
MIARSIIFSSMYKKEQKNYFYKILFDTNTIFLKFLSLKKGRSGPDIFENLPYKINYIKF